MAALGMLGTWFGYSVTLWGYCLVKGYNVTFAQLVNPVHPYRGPWPPPQDIPSSTVLPTGAGGQAAATAAKAPAGQASGPAAV